MQRLSKLGTPAPEKKSSLTKTESSCSSSSSNNSMQIFLPAYLFSHLLEEEPSAC